MKKWTALLLTMALLCAWSPVLALESTDVTGVWYLVSMNMGGVEYLPDEVGVWVSMDLQADGTAILNSAGEEQTGKWSVSGSSVGVVDASGSMMLLKATGMNLVMTMNDGSLMTFGRESVRKERPLGVGVSSPEELYGVWKAAFMYTDVLLMDTEAMGLDMRLRIDEAGITEVSDEGDGATWTVQIINGWLVGMNPAGQPALLLYKNADGTMTLYNPDGSLCFVPVTNE